MATKQETRNGRVVLFQMRLRPDLYEWLVQLSKSEGRSRNKQLERMIEDCQQRTGVTQPQ